MLDILGFLDDDDMILGHHGVATCLIDYLGGVDVRAEEYGLVEVALLWL